MIIEGFLLTVTIIFGTLLTRSTLHEINQRERIELLASELNNANRQLKDTNDHLEAKVAEQTKEIRHAFDLEKKARRELEKLNETKDQFIMITQHHLRTPVTSIRWTLEEMTKGTYGKITGDLKNALAGANKAVGRLIRIVDDFLSITALKVGSQILTKTSESMLTLLNDVFEELHIDIENKHIAISYPKELKAWPHIEVDSSKMREVLLIIVENAVKYNHDNGQISIKPEIRGDRFVVTINNTGIGISEENRQKLFTSLFFRTDESRKANPIGMGVGLSVARAIVRAHHGELTIKSLGENKGAEVEITLPK